jgi:folylpolyglutamate synthase/dihydropteroate synthase
MAKLISDTDARVILAPLSSGNTHAEKEKSPSGVLNTESSRAMPPDDLARMLHTLDVKTASVLSLADGLSWFYENATRKDGLLITGSHYLVSQYYHLEVR